MGAIVPTASDGAGPASDGRSTPDRREHSSASQFDGSGTSRPEPVVIARYGTRSYDDSASRGAFAWTAR
jgi:hypothetical protein